MENASPEQALLFAGTLYNHDEFLSRAKERLEASFGRIIQESPALEWDYSDYYREELGWPIKKKFLFFRDRINPESLSEIKLITNNIEQDLSASGKRNINIDPGYLTSAKVVLASTKNYSHRICIGKGIYAEVTLVHMNGRYQPHIFTYPDYSSDEYMRIFEDARKLLR